MIGVCAVDRGGMSTATAREHEVTREGFGTQSPGICGAEASELAGFSSSEVKYKRAGYKISAHYKRKGLDLN